MFWLTEVTLEKLEAFIPQLLSRLYLEMLVYGNVTREVGLPIDSLIKFSCWWMDLWSKVDKFDTFIETVHLVLGH